MEDGMWMADGGFCMFEKSLFNVPLGTHQESAAPVMSVVLGWIYGAPITREHLKKTGQGSDQLRLRSGGGGRSSPYVCRAGKFAEWMVRDASGFLLAAAVLGAHGMADQRFGTSHSSHLRGWQAKLAV